MANPVGGDRTKHCNQLLWKCQSAAGPYRVFGILRQLLL